MDSLQPLKHMLQTERPVHWEELPDIDLYRDQVLNYMPRQQVTRPCETPLTGAMINNYIKMGLVPRANGKRYTKEHLAYLTAICALKQVLSVSDVDFLFKQAALDPALDAKTFYETYWSLLDVSLHQTAEQVVEDSPEDQWAAIALQLAISSYTQKLACEHLLDLLRQREEAKNPPAKGSKTK